jgi:hypothetical protein
MTRQQHFERKGARYFNAAHGTDDRAHDKALFDLGHYVAQNAHLVTIKSGNGVQEAMRSRKRR